MKKISAYFTTCKTKTWSVFDKFWPQNWKSLETKIQTSFHPPFLALLFSWLFFLIPKFVPHGQMKIIPLRTAPAISREGSLHALTFVRFAERFLTPRNDA